MSKWIIFVITLGFASIAFAQPKPQSNPQPEPLPIPSPDWTASQANDLRLLLQDMTDEGLSHCNISSDFSDDNAEEMTALAKRLADAHLQGCTKGLDRARWHITSRDGLIDSDKLIRLALRRDELNMLFNAMRPQNPNYAALRTAMRQETDPEKRRILALNMERWRWMPLYLGTKYLVVNAASYEVTLWDNHQKIGTWPVIVGKTKTPTPIFDTVVRGVIFNPWWEIPTSIAAEGISAMVRNNPSAARRKGYVYQNGRYRQRPGPANALGQMKLIMPNAYSVYLHDTSNRKLFANEVRTYSHGCVRVGDAIGFTKALLASDIRENEVDQIVEKGATVPTRMSFPIPIYIAYFTAEGDDRGGVEYHPDIYRRDGTALAAAHSGKQMRQQQCS